MGGIPAREHVVRHFGALLRRGRKPCPDHMPGFGINDRSTAAAGATEHLVGRLVHLGGRGPVDVAAAAIPMLGDGAAAWHFVAHYAQCFRGVGASSLGRADRLPLLRLIVHPTLMGAGGRCWRPLLHLLRCGAV